MVGYDFSVMFVLSDWNTSIACLIRSLEGKPVSASRSFVRVREGLSGDPHSECPPQAPDLSLRPPGAGRACKSGICQGYGDAAKSLSTRLNRAAKSGESRIWCPRGNEDSAMTSVARHR